MKYIMLNVNLGSISKKIPVIFPDILVDEDIAKVMKVVPMLENSEVISAGSIDIVATAIHGESPTLKLKSRDEDIITINNYDYLHGVE